jgi:hypothetical protein
LFILANPLESLSQASIRREIGRLFRDFLLTFIPSRDSVSTHKLPSIITENEINETIPTPFYRQILDDAYKHNKTFIEISFRHLWEVYLFIFVFLLFIIILV